MLLFVFLVSIHAPVWGATIHGDWIAPQLRFNPRPRMGGDSGAGGIQPKAVEFQSTPPYGGRLQRIYEPRHVFRFNPRPRMGGDLKYAIAGSSPISFNPRPRMGGDRYTWRYRIRCGSFNPRPRMGGDSSVRMGNTLQMVSIHAPVWGATRSRYVARGVISGFNPRPRMGGDLF